MKQIKAHEIIVGKIYIIESVNYNNDSFDFATYSTDLINSEYNVRIVSHSTKRGYIVPLSIKNHNGVRIYQFITLEGRVAFDKLLNYYYKIFEVENEEN